MKAVVAAFNQKKALVGTFSVITNLRMNLFKALLATLATLAIVSNLHNNFYPGSFGAGGRGAGDGIPR